MYVKLLQIGNLEGYYHFQLNVSQPIDATLGKSVSRSIGSLSHMMSAPDLTRTLQQHQNVGGYITLYRALLSEHYLDRKEPLVKASPDGRTPSIKATLL